MNTATLTTATPADEEPAHCETCGEVLTADEFPQCTKCQADADAVYCDCGVALTDADLDEYGEQCSKCYAASHFACTDCNETLDNDERSTKCKTRCMSCDEAKAEAELEEKMDVLREEARDLLDSICVDGDLAGLKKTVAALTRLQPQ